PEPARRKRETVRLGDDSRRHAVARRHSCVSGAGRAGPRERGAHEHPRRGRRAMALADERRCARRLGCAHARGAGRTVGQEVLMRSAKQMAPLPRVAALAQNLWWTWNAGAQRLFASLDPLLWEATGHNPVKTLRLLTPERHDVLTADNAFVDHLERCENQLAEYLRTPTWFGRKKHSLL